MMLKIKISLTFFLLSCILFSSVCLNGVIAQTVTPSPTPDNSQAIGDLQKQISDLENKISDLQGQEKTLSSQIALADSNIKLTEYRIRQTNEQILSLEEDINTAQNKISHLEASLSSLTKILVSRMVAGYEVGTQNQFQVLLASNSITDFFARANYLRVVEHHDRLLVYDTVQAKDDYANQKKIFEEERKKVIALQIQLESYNQELNDQKSAKQSLLAQTQGDEATYQSQLAQAQAQLAGFSSFVTSQGGASLLSGQTSCDSWGCYYNQRDSQWGNLVVNGSNDCGGPCSIAKIGCLITSVAMVASHHGHNDILPSDIAVSGGGNFAVGTAMLRVNAPIYVKGVTINRSQIGRSSGAIPGTITDPIIVGISYDGGPWPDHFVVLVSGTSGNYMMNDPFTPNGKEIPFTSHYSLRSIVEVDSISM